MSANAALIGRAADHLLRMPYACWAYGDSVGFEAMLAATEATEATEATGDPRYLSFAHGFFRAWAARAEPYREIDNTAPGLAMVLTAERTNDSRLLQAAVGLADYLASRRRVRDLYHRLGASPAAASLGTRAIATGGGDAGAVAGCRYLRRLPALRSAVLHRTRAPER